jgi:hypothetical protein
MLSPKARIRVIPSTGGGTGGGGGAGGSGVTTGGGVGVVGCPPPHAAASASAMAAHQTDIRYMGKCKGGRVSGSITLVLSPTDHTDHTDQGSWADP